MNDDLATTAVLDTTGVNNGVLTNAGNTEDVSVAGKINKALDFDGVDDYVEIPDNNSLHFGTGDFSLCTWFLTSSINGVIIAKDVYTQADAFELFIYSHYLRLGSNGNYTTVISQNVLDDGKFHFVVAGRKGNDAFLYVDGISQGTFTNFFLGLTITNTHPLSIGKRLTGSATPFTGLLDDVRIYDTAISAYYIKLLYNNGAGTEDENVQSNTLLLGCNF